MTSWLRQDEGWMIAFVSPVGTMTSAADIEGSGRLKRFARQDQRGILAAETERIRHHGGDSGVARGIGNHVEWYRRIGYVVVDGRRYPLVLKRQQRENSFNRARRRNGMADHRLVGRYRNLLGAFTEHGGDSEIFHFVVFRRRSAVRVDVVDLFRRHAGIRQSLAHTADDRFAVGAGAGAVERVGQFTTAGNDPENRGAAP